VRAQEQYRIAHSLLPKIVPNAGVQKSRGRMVTLEGEEKNVTNGKRDSKDLFHFLEERELVGRPWQDKSLPLTCVPNWPGRTILTQES